MRWRWLVALLPAVAGLLTALVAALGVITNPILYLRGDLGTLALLFGLLTAAVAAWAVWREQQAAARIRQARAEAVEDRRRFSQRLDHELKNPLTAIRAGLANLAGSPLAESSRSVLATLDEQALRLSSLAANLRKLADLETRPLERGPVNMADLLREVLAVAQERPGATARRLTLTLPQAPWPLPTIQGDNDLLFLAIHNLVDNALKFTRPNDTVEVRALEDGTAIVIEVADTGPGIPDGEVDHVWEELYRGQGARGIPGSGLGLALVRAIIERHGGRVDLRSRTGQGTVLSVRLPV